MRAIIVASVLLVGASAAQAKLEIKDVKAVQGLYGPERKNLTFMPGDEVFFRFQVSGVSTDKEGKLDCIVSVRLSDAKGKELLKQSTPLKGVLVFGGNTLITNAFVNFGDGFAVGEYTITVTVDDKLANAQDSFSRKLTCQPVKFAIVAPRFFYDEGYRAPAPVGGVAGQSLHFVLKAVGFERGSGKIDDKMEVDVLDAAGKSVMAKPIETQFITDDAAAVKKASSLTFRGSLALNRAGSYTLRITIIDRLSKKSTTFEAPLKITAP